MTLCGNSSVIVIPGNATKSTLLEAVCALLNSDGGKIKICETALDVRSMEQIIMKVIGNANFLAHLKIEKSKSDIADCKVIVNVRKSEKLVTVSYNLCLPTQKQITTVASTDDIEIVKRILERQGISEDSVIKGSHVTNFIIDEASGLDESDVVQLKSLKVKASNNTAKAITFAKRMVAEKNKICSYMSGFANHKGGHIYYGINDECVVTGEKLHEKDVKEVEDETTKVIRKLIWTENRIEPQKGKDWEIYFEKVKDEYGEIVDSTYVVVVFVSFCRGGVFTAEPESYYFEDEQIVKMEFGLWWKSFKRGAFSTRKVFKPRDFTHLSWSSEENKEFFIKLSEKLVDFRDAGDFDSFDKLCELCETEKFQKRNAGLVVKAGRITIAYKSGDLTLAKSLLKDFEKMLTTSNDRPIFEVRLRLSQSLVARREKNYLECYEKGQEGLQLGQKIPPGLCLLWLYLECAMNAACLGFQNQHDNKTYGEMKREALGYLENAASLATTLTKENIPYRMTDFQHKLRIYRAWVLINNSVTGEAAVIAPSKEDLDAAKEELSFFEKMYLDVDIKSSLTEFRVIELFLVKCDYFTRQAEIATDEMAETGLLKNALREASVAVMLAENKFDNLFKYAQYRSGLLEAKLKNLGHKESSERTFEGIKF